MLKMDKQVNRNTLIAVSIPFAINLFIDIFSRSPYYEKFQAKFLPKKLSSLVKNDLTQPEIQEKTDINNVQNPYNIKQVNGKFDPALEEYFKQHNINNNISFGVSYTTVHLLGKLVNKIRGAGAQTYDVYSACNQLDMPKNKVNEATTLKFFRELSSQLIENIIYFAVLIKLKKKLDTSLAMAIVIPAALTIAIDILNRSKAFDFLNKWSENLFKSDIILKPEHSTKNRLSLDSPAEFQQYLGYKYAFSKQTK